MIKIRDYKMNDRSIRKIFNRISYSIKPVTGKYTFTTKEDVIEFIRINKEKLFLSSVIKNFFQINEVTERHLFLKGRPQADYLRRVKLFGPGLEIIEETGVLISIDRETDHDQGIVYYEIIGIDPNIANTIIHVKLSEVNKNGKIYFTVFAISGGAPVPATSSSDRRPGRITTSDI